MFTCRTLEGRLVGLGRGSFETKYNSSISMHIMLHLIAFLSVIALRGKTNLQLQFLRFAALHRNHCRLYNNFKKPSSLLPLEKLHFNILRKVE